MIVQVFPRREAFYCLSKLTRPPSFHPWRHVKTMLYCHDVRAGTVNRTNRMSKTFRRQTDSCTTRFLCKKLACKNTVCLFTDKQTLCHATRQKCMYFHYRKIFPKGFIRYWEFGKLPILSLSPLLQRHFSFSSPGPSPARSRQGDLYVGGAGRFIK